MKFPMCVLTAVSVVLVLPAAAHAQYAAWRAAAGMAEPARETVAATGLATVEREPASIRLYVELFGRGATLEEALKNLKDRREAATSQLETMHADMKTVTFSPPTLTNMQSEQRQQMERMIRQRLGRAAKKLEMPKSVTASATLTADWPLEVKTVEERMLLAKQLEEKVRAADLAGAKGLQERSPEEEELAEEMSEMMSGYGEEEIEYGAPHFVYVARISEEDRQKAAAEAFQHARSQAEQLAKAAGVGLGPLVGLSGQDFGSTEFAGEDYGVYSGFAYEQRQYVEAMMGRLGETRRRDARDEVTSPNPSKLSFMFSVNALFGMQR